MKYAFIKVYQDVFAVTRMCELFSVSQSAYYDWLSRHESQRSAEDRRLTEKIKLSHKGSRTRVGRLMGEQGLASKTRRKFKATTHSNHNKPVAPNLLNREFEVDYPDTVYAGDISYIPTDEGWLYLAVLIDLYSRAVVGWAMSERMTAPLVNDALMMAMGKRKPTAGLMVHSDRGSQYASNLYQGTIKRNGFICSMSRRGNCWDNAPSESFFHTLKTELTHHQRYRTREEAKQDIFEYIEVFYNRQRRHSTIGYQAPLAYDTAYLKAA